MAESTCSSCGAPVVWRTRPPAAEGAKPKPIPCDPLRILIRVDVAGDQADTTLVCEDGVTRRGLRVQNVREKGLQLGTYCTGRVSHFATCPDAERHRR